ncbi:hypothetical protein TKK_0008710 [Trichogramma kaykai]
MQVNPTATGESKKWQKKFKGPLVIYRVLPGGTYGVKDLNPDQEGRQYASTAHVSQLKQWKPFVEDAELTDDEYSTDDERAEGTTNKPNDTTEERQNPRPARNRKQSKRLEDFIVSKK